MIDYDSLATPFARHRRFDPEVLRALASRTRPEYLLLDVGCGTGNYSLALHETTACACWGIDPSLEMLAAAQKKIGSDAVTFRHGRAESLAFPDDSFDLIFSVNVIHHVADRRAYFQEAHRVLRPGGRVCTVTESEAMVRQRVHSFYFPETVEVELARYPSIAALREFLVEAGFRELDEQAVESPTQITDITGYRERAFSCLHLIAPHAFQRGIERMERDLRAGPIAAVSQNLLLWGTKCSN